MDNLTASPFPFLAIKTKPFWETVRPTFCSTQFLPLGGSREWTWSSASFQLRRLQSGCWPVPLRVLDGCRSFPPPASFSENQSWETISSRCSTLPTTPRSVLTFQMGKLMSQRREDLCKVPQATVREPAPLPSSSAATPGTGPMKGELRPG